MTPGLRGGLPAAALAAGALCALACAESPADRPDAGAPGAESPDADLCDFPVRQQDLVLPDGAIDLDHLTVNLYERTDDSCGLSLPLRASARVVSVVLRVYGSEIRNSVWGISGPPAPQPGPRVYCRRYDADGGVAETWRSTLGHIALDHAGLGRARGHFDVQMAPFDGDLQPDGGIVEFHRDFDAPRCP